MVLGIPKGKGRLDAAKNIRARLASDFKDMLCSLVLILLNLRVGMKI